MSPDELLDVTDASDTLVIGQIWRSQIVPQGIKNYRVVNAFIRNDAGLLWVPTRHPNKRIFPLCFDCSMGGHVSAGEDYETSFQRETLEELNIDIHAVSWRLLGHLKQAESGLSANMKVYEIQMNTSPNYNPNDYVNAAWYKPTDIVRLLEDGAPAKGDLLRLLKCFYVA